MIFALVLAPAAALADVTVVVAPKLPELSVYAETYTALGANAAVYGNVWAGQGLTIGANATVTGHPGSMGASNAAAGATVGGPIASAHAYLAGTGSGQALASTMTTDTTLFAGVYSAASFSTTAGTTLTLDGQGRDSQIWVFNLTDYLVTGASTKVVLINGGLNHSIFWNSGGYVALGATANLLGTVMATDYISVGAGTLVSGIGSSCGGLFSTTSYVSMGAGSIAGGLGCSSMAVIGLVPEPSSGMLLVAGLGLLGFLVNRRLSSRIH